jgi:sugar O-acyltransferase (sialic acid O-acetyltransferase NeuD family)
MKRALIGAGGHAREVMMQIGEILHCFVDDEYVTKDTLPLSSFNPDKYEVMVAIGESKSRYDMVSKLPINTQYFSYTHPSALIGWDVVVGEGSFIGANVIVTTNVNIGKHALLNRASQIGHDVVIGDYFSAMPGTIISGNVIIGDRVYIGSNATIKEKLKVCDDVAVGLNSGVVKDITEKGIYVGVPSHILKK